MRPTAMVVLGWVAAAAAAAAPAQPPEYQRHVSTIQEQQQLAGAFGAPPHQVLAGLNIADLDVRQARWDRVVEMHRARRDWPELRSFLRASLWSEDRAVALGAALLIEYQWLDAHECRRYIDVVLGSWTKPASPLNLNDFHSIAGSVDLPRILTALPAPRHEGFVENAIENLHRVARPEHVPDYCRAALVAEGPLRAALLNTAHLVTNYSTGQEPTLARTLLAIHAPKRARVPAADGEGWPPLLAGMLELLFERPELREKSGYLIRWAARSRASKRDLDLLVRLVQAGVEDVWADGRFIAVRALRHLEGDVVLRTVTEVAAEGANSPGALAVRSTLAHLDDELSVTVLQQQSREEAAALTYLLELPDPAHAAELRARLLHPNWAVAGRAIALCREARELATEEPLPWDEGIFDALVAAADAADLDGRHMRALLATFPQLRTKRMARRFLMRFGPRQLLEPEQLRALSSTPAGDPAVPDILEIVPFCGSVWGFLEVTVPDELRVALRACLVIDHLGVRTRAARMLLALGDPDSGADLVQVVQSGELDTEDEWAVDARVLLGSSFGPVVAEFLRGTAARLPAIDRAVDAAGWRTSLHALGGLAVAYGLPIPAARDWLSRGIRGLDAAELRAVVAEVLAGRPADAFVATLRPDSRWRDVGLVRDPRVRAHLQEQVRRRTLGYPWALKQLAIFGDEAARGDLWAKMQDGRYRWVDSESDSRAMTLDFALPRIPLWINDLSAACCRRNVANEILESCSASYPDYTCVTQTGGPLETAGVVYQRWFERSVGRLRWSRIENRYVTCGE